MADLKVEQKADSKAAQRVGHWAVQKAHQKADY
jgi:hypothetical protein